MLTTRAIIEAAKGEPNYLFAELVGTTKSIEIEEQMTLFVHFTRNQSSLWNMLVAQADEHFEFKDETHPTTPGEACVERIYTTPTSQFGVILSNDFIDGFIRVQMTLPISERALDKFIVWIPSPPITCQFLSEVLKLGLAERSQSEHYVPGGLLDI